MNNILLALIIMGLLGTISISLIAYVKIVSWKKHPKPVTRGTLVMGDDMAMPTRWWNHWALATFGWKTVAILEARSKDVFPGFKPITGDIAYVSTERLREGNRFRMRIGREACTFFAIDLSGNEVRVDFVKKARIDDLETRSLPLY